MLYTEEKERDAYKESENDVMHEFLKDIILNRNSKDNECNYYGYRLLDLYKNLSIVIANGRLGNNKHNGDKTCNGKSIIHYIILTPTMLTKVTKFDVLPFCHLLSDKHIAISMSVSVTKKPILR